MRIAQIGAVVTPEGAFGGPVRVAVNQTRELRAQGHDVALFAGSHGFRSPPDQIDGVNVTLFPTRQLVPGSGFLGQVSFQMLQHLRSVLAQFDVVHVHVGRDLVTLPAARLVAKRDRPYVVQCHGMIVESGHRLASPLDFALTRPVLKRASAVLYLTEAERVGLLGSIDPSLRLQHLANGVPQSENVVASQGALEVLFMARMQARKRPVAFVEAAAEVACRVPDVRFTLIGPDEGVGGELSDRIAALKSHGRIVWEGALSSDQTLDRMSRADVFVLPSVNEPFPMAVLEAMSLGIPVIITQSCGLAGPVAEARAGLVIDTSQGSLVDAISRLTMDESLRCEMGLNAHKLVHEDFSMETIGRQLVSHYTRAVNQPPKPRKI